MPGATGRNKTYLNDSKDAKPAAFGNFMTVWKKQTDGSWKFALDLGISNPEPKASAMMWQALRLARVRAPVSAYGRLFALNSEIGQRHGVA